MRVVFDANVFVSAAIRTGPSNRIVLSWLETGAPDVVICESLLAEVAEVLLERPRLRRWIDRTTAEDYLATITTLADVHPDPPAIPATTRDPDDDYLIALARQHHATHLVTGDHDLLDWKGDHPIVVTPAQFEALLRTGTTT